MPTEQASAGIYATAEVNERGRVVPIGQSLAGRPPGLGIRRPRRCPEWSAGKWSPSQNEGKQPLLATCLSLFSQVRRRWDCQKTPLSPFCDGLACLADSPTLDAKRARLLGKQGPWTDYPERQCYWRAASLAYRDGAADALMGLAVAEEVRDYEIEACRDHKADTSSLEDMPAAQEASAA